MGVASTCLSAVAAGALTAGVVASNVVVAPDTTATAPAVTGVGMSAIKIPIVDIDQTVGPLTFSRLLEVVLDSAPNALSGTLNSAAGSIWDFPRLDTNFTNNSSGHQTLSAIRKPGESIEFGFTSSGPVDSSWKLLGLAAGDTGIQRSRELNFTALTGGAEGIGAALGGTLSNSSVHRAVTVLDRGFTADSARKVGDFAGQLSLMPFDGFKAVGSGTLVDTGGDTNFKLGSLQVGGGGHGALSGDAGLCLGSAQGTTSCAGQSAFASLGAPVDFAVHTGDSMTNLVSGDFKTNKLTVSVKDRQLSVTGAIGGTIKVGSVSIGGPIPINIQIPRASSMMLASSNRQTQTVRNSLQAVPRNSASDNETGGRHQVSERVADVKAAVSDAVHGRHAKPDTAE